MDAGDQIPLPKGIIAVTLPTLNEADNIGQLIREIRAIGTEIHIVVADDDSPDGTAKIVEEIARIDPMVHLLLRTQNKGRGSAGVDAFRRALTLGADYVVEMDADFSHHPKYIPSLLREMQHADVAIGSRLVQGGGEAKRGFIRKYLTILSCAYSRIVLGLPVHDMNSGYRCFRREILESVDWDHFLSTGPSIVHELNYRCFLHGARFAEVPIHFYDRRKGQSKLNLARLAKGFTMVVRLRHLHTKGIV